MIPALRGGVEMKGQKATLSYRESLRPTWADERLWQTEAPCQTVAEKLGAEPDSSPPQCLIGFLELRLLGRQGGNGPFKSVAQTPSWRARSDVGRARLLSKHHPRKGPIGNSSPNHPQTVVSYVSVLPKTDSHTHKNPLSEAHFVLKNGQK